MSPEELGTNQESVSRTQGLPRADDVETWFVHNSTGASVAAAGDVIGPYQLRYLLGHGGMGEVWLAEQKQPVRRRVALKLIKAGMDTREVVARFESERQALALMDHPAIAKVFDAGSTMEGRPYFVMEYVSGIPITDYCDKHRLTMRQRLELFIRVCDGVQHAHQKAILHRDLKPSNILVGETDGVPAPRIIDFGVAKATAQGASSDTVFTRVGTIVGTLGYMSPEQADSGGADVDTRTDVYSLGVILYQLLVGAPPFDFRKLAYDEILRRLREDDAPRPSTQLRTLAGESAIAARKRGADVPTLTRQLRGDADAIALKALEKDRTRRYATPSDLAADVGRYLRNEPVNARPASAGYRARKYIRRHRLAVAVAGAGALLLIGFAIVQAVQLRRITRERDRADRITHFMTGMFRVSNPSEARGTTVTAREILDKSAREIGAGLSSEPELQAQLMYTMADTYAGLGLYQRAQSLLDGALVIQRRVLGPDHRDTLASTRSLAGVLANEGRYADAETLYRETINIQRRVLGPQNPATLASMSLLGSVLANERHYTDAEKLYRETIDMERRVLGPEHPDTLRSMSMLGYLLVPERRYAEADKLQREALDLQRRVLGLEHPDTLVSMADLATTLRYEGRYAEAERMTRETLAIQRKVLGPEHSLTLLSMNNLAGTLMNDHRYAEAEKLYRETMDIRRRTLGPLHPSTLTTLENLAVNLSYEGRYSDAEPLFREGVQAAESAGQPGMLARAWYNFALGAAIAGRREQALEYLSQAVDHGYRGLDKSGLDDTLKPLSGDPRFEALVTRARPDTVTGLH
ncbi:MAG TPA: serine/threonine-protein kinase [Bryobacteraceae bacterium]|nr:serine/threonine-protein kinase [Bryobacteraceae bacterium]